MSLNTSFQPDHGARHIGEVMGGIVVGMDRAQAAKAGKSVIQNLADVGGWTAPEEGSERYRMLTAALLARGVPYRSGGGDGCHDAWSLAHHCAAYATERDCIAIERVRSGWGCFEHQARAALTQWGLSEVRLRHAAPGDLLLFDMPEERLPGGSIYPGGFHVAVMSAPGGELSWAMAPGRTLPEAKMIHASPARAVVEAWVGPFWTDKLVGAFSFDAPGSPLRPVMAEAA